MAGAKVERVSLQHVAVGWQRKDLSEAAYVVYDPIFEDMIGDSPALTIECEMDWPFAHEAGVFIPKPSGDEVYITSNQIGSVSSRYIAVSRMQQQADGSWKHSRIDADVKMANGGTKYKDGVLFCDQGNHDERGGLVVMDPHLPYQCRVLIDSFHGRRFNSPNDVVVHSDGSIWFTDPIYGSEQGICPPPELPNQVYRFHPDTGSVRAVADGLQRPNGLAFSPDESTLYVTDTAWIHGDGTTDDTRPSTIYAFDVVKRDGGVFLCNRRLFAMADTPIPDGIKCDVDGNVYSGCGDGVHVWNTTGRLIGKIAVPGGVANFCFGRPGELFLLNESRFWRAKMNDSVPGA